MHCFHLPQNAMQQVPVDFTVSIAEMPGLLARLSEGDMEEQSRKQPQRRDGLGHTGFTCPDCHGPISETRRDPVEFRCRVGHTFSTRMLLDGNASVRERKLYEAMVALEEGADIAEYASTQAEESKREELMQKAQELRRQAGFAREILQQIPPITLD